MGSLLQWFAGGSQHPYTTIFHCMAHDTLWIVVTVVLDLLVASGYVVIAVHWWKNQKLVPDKMPAKAALGTMRNIFVFCGICGYLFIPIKMFWPAWRLYDFFMAALVYFTWKYALSAGGLKVVYSELGRAQKLKDDLAQTREESKRKSSFLNALSHDLRTPLNGLLLQANYAEISLKSGEASVVREALHEIKACTRAASELLDGLMEYAKADWADDANSPDIFSLDECLSQMVARFRSPAEEKGLCIKLGAACETQIRTDRLKFERIVNNLLSNAVKFTEIGSIRVETQCVKDGVEVHVIDSGIGVDPALRERLFEEFFQVHNHERDPRKGFGLGLSIARRLVGQLGGEIQFESAPGAGSRFSVVLPGVVVARVSLAAEPERQLVGVDK